MTAEERAKEIANELRECNAAKASDYYPLPIGWVERTVATAIREAEADARLAAIEEAAKIVEEEVISCERFVKFSGLVGRIDRIAANLRATVARIRSLKKESK